MDTPFQATRDDVLASLVSAYQYCVSRMDSSIPQLGVPPDWTGWVIENMDMGEIATEASAHHDYVKLDRLYEEGRIFGKSQETTGFGLAGVKASGTTFRQVSFKDVPLTGDFSRALFEDCDLREEAFRSSDLVLEGAKLVRPKLTILYAANRKGAEVVNAEFYMPEFDYPGGGERVYGLSETPDGSAVYKTPPLKEYFLNAWHGIRAKEVLRRYREKPDAEFLQQQIMELLQGQLPNIVIDMIGKHRGEPVDQVGLKRDIADQARLALEKPDKTFDGMTTDRHLLKALGSPKPDKNKPPMP